MTRLPGARLARPDAGCDSGGLFSCLDHGCAAGVPLFVSRGQNHAFLLRISLVRRAPADPATQRVDSLHPQRRAQRGCGHLPMGGLPTRIGRSQLPTNRPAGLPDNVPEGGGAEPPSDARGRSIGMARRDRGGGCRSAAAQRLGPHAELTPLFNHQRVLRTAPPPRVSAAHPPLPHFATLPSTGAIPVPPCHQAPVSPSTPLPTLMTMPLPGHPSRRRRRRQLTHCRAGGYGCVLQNGATVAGALGAVVAAAEVAAAGVAVSVVAVAIDGGCGRGTLLARRPLTMPPAANASAAAVDAERRRRRVAWGVGRRAATATVAGNHPSDR